MITILSSRHAGEVFKHLRRASGLTPIQLAKLLHISRRTLDGREKYQQGIPTDALIDTAAQFNFAVALIPQRHPGARSTGTGWPV